MATESPENAAMIRMYRKLPACAAGFGVPTAAMSWLAFHRGPLAPVQMGRAALTESGLTDSVSGIGTVETPCAVAIEPTRAGRVLTVLVEYGDKVKTERVVAEIDPVVLQQRLSIARARARKPPIILADEPTAPLDSTRALTVLLILSQLAREYRTAIIVVTHDEKSSPRSSA